MTQGRHTSDGSCTVCINILTTVSKTVAEPFSCHRVNGMKSKVSEQLCGSFLSPINWFICIGQNCYSSELKQEKAYTIEHYFDMPWHLRYVTAFSFAILYRIIEECFLQVSNISRNKTFKWISQENRILILKTGSLLHKRCIWFWNHKIVFTRQQSLNCTNWTTYNFSFLKI